MCDLIPFWSPTSDKLPTLDIRCSSCSSPIVSRYPPSRKSNMATTRVTFIFALKLLGSSAIPQYAYARDFGLGNSNSMGQECVWPLILQTGSGLFTNWYGHIWASSHIWAMGCVCMRMCLRLKKRQFQTLEMSFASGWWGVYVGVVRRKDMQNFESANFIQIPPYWLDVDSVMGIQMLAEYGHTRIYGMRCRFNERCCAIVTHHYWPADWR